MTQRKKVYIETSVVSYLFANPSRDLIIAGKQQITWEWWHTKRSKYKSYISELVLREAQGGDPQQALKRIEVITRIPILKFDEKIVDIASMLMDSIPLPKKALNDALHIALCIWHRIDFLVSWNCKHIANPTNQKVIAHISNINDWNELTICTPLEMLGD